MFPVRDFFLKDGGFVNVRFGDEWVFDDGL